MTKTRSHPTETMFAITGIKNDGARSLSAANQRRFLYPSIEIAKQRLYEIKQNEYNDPITVEQCMGKDLKVSAVQCYIGGDAIGIYWD